MGDFTHSMDPKKRLTIPSEWRESTGAPYGLYVMPDLEGQGFLIVFPAQEMVHRLQSIRNLSIADAKGRQFARILGSRSQMVSWDTAGRIRINDSLLEHAKLSDQHWWAPLTILNYGIRSNGSGRDPRVVPIWVKPLGM